MQIDGSIVYYLLTREFDDVACSRPSRLPAVDYPILYDEDADMRGHTVLVPAHERPHAGLRLERSICVCVGDACAVAAHNEGFPVVRVGNDVSFPQLYNYMQEVFVRYERLDAQLRAYVDAYAGVQALLDACAETVGLSFALVDDQYREICHAAWGDGAADGSETGLDLLEADAVDLFMASRNYQSMRLNRKVFTAPGSVGLLMKNLFVGDSLKGVLVSRHDGDSPSVLYVRAALKYLSRFIEESYARIGSFGVAPTGSDRIRAGLSDLLSDRTANRTDIQTLLVENGHAANSYYVVLRIERSFTYEGREDFEYLARRFELSWPHTYCFESEGILFMLADIGQVTVPGRDFLQGVLIAARDNLSKVGVSRSFAWMESLDAACMQATAALEQGNAADPTYWFYRFDDYALTWILNHGVADVPFEYVAHPAVIVLSRYDAEHGTELLRTLATFVRYRYNATHASAELYVARSTLLNRLERIIELTGLDFEDADGLVYLGVSLFAGGTQASSLTA